MALIPRTTEVHVCDCGCGEQTGGSSFRPGHDPKLQSILLDQSGIREMGPTQQFAIFELAHRGWMLGGPSIWGAGRATMDEHGGVDAFIRAQVQARTMLGDYNRTEVADV